MVTGGGQAKGEKLRCVAEQMSDEFSLNHTN